MKFWKVPGAPSTGQKWSGFSGSSAGPGSIFQPDMITTWIKLKSKRFVYWKVNGILMDLFVSWTSPPDQTIGQNTWRSHKDLSSSLFRKVICLIPEDTVFQCVKTWWWPSGYLYNACSLWLPPEHPDLVWKVRRKPFIDWWVNHHFLSFRTLWCPSKCRSLASYSLERPTPISTRVKSLTWLSPASGLPSSTVRNSWRRWLPTSTMMATNF